MVGFTNGFAQGLNQTYRPGAGDSGQMTEYQAERLKQQQASTDAQTATAQSRISLNDTKMETEELKQKRLELDQEFEAGVVKSASEGGFSAAIDFAQKQGRYEWAASRLKEQSELNNSLAEGKKLEADASSAEIKAYNDRQKALGGLAGAFYTDIKSGKPAEQVYEQYKPVIKQIWKDAPEKFDDKTDSMLKIALSQSLQQNANYSRITQVGKLLKEREQAIKAGDTEGTGYYDAQLKKVSMFVNPQTGEVYNLMGNAPDTHIGSVDTKANALGLGAGSTIPPVNGAAFHNQPMNNMMDNTYKQYDKDNGIKPEARTIRNLKSAPGFNQIILPDGTNIQDSIEGSKADTIKGNLSDTVRLEALSAGQYAYNKMNDILFDSKGEIKPEALGLLGDIDQSALIGSSDNPIVNRAINTAVGDNAQLIRGYQEIMIEGITRGLTGAAKSLTETPELKRMLLAQPGDRGPVIKAKMIMTHEILNGSLNILKYGLKGGIKRNEEGVPELDLNIVNKALDYAKSGGDILDITKGNGADPEKARQSMLKELSYDPKLVKMIMSAQTNGQGRDYTEQEAKALIDNMPKKGQQQGGQ